MGKVTKVIPCVTTENVIIDHLRTIEHLIVLSVDAFSYNLVKMFIMMSRCVAYKIHDYVKGQGHT